MNELDKVWWVVEENSFPSCKDSFHCYDGLHWGNYHTFQSAVWCGMSPFDEILLETSMSFMLHLENIRQKSLGNSIWVFFSCQIF